MFKQGDIVLYGSEGVCMIDEVMTRKFKDQLLEYFILKSVYNPSSKIFIPTQNEDLMSRMKDIMSKDEIYQLIAHINEEELIWIDHDNSRKEKYKEIMRNGQRNELVSLIKTLSLRNKELKLNGKKLNAMDDQFFRDAQKLLNGEIAYVFNIQQDEVGPFISKQMGGDLILS
ncbi:MAG: CarD family transcriptional regulator [Coprobacillus sp.]